MMWTKGIWQLICRGKQPNHHEPHTDHIQFLCRNTNDSQTNYPVLLRAITVYNKDGNSEKEIYALHVGMGASNI